MKILIADPIDKKAFGRLQKLGEVKDVSELSRPELLKEVQAGEILIVRSHTQVDKELIGRAEILKAVIRAGVGLDNIDADFCAQKNIKVLNTPEAPAISVAELAMGLILSLLRKIPAADLATKSEKWLKSELKGNELFGKTLGIIGFGKIGREVAARAKAFGMKILIYTEHSDSKGAGEFGINTTFEDVLQNSDIVTLHVPLTSQTQNMISDVQFSMMKEGAYLINTSRGEIVNESALANALGSGKLAGAGLDVYWDETPFKSKIMQFREKLVLTPHIGAQTAEAQARVGELLVEKVKQVIKESGLNGQA